MWLKASENHSLHRFTCCLCTLSLEPNFSFHVGHLFHTEGLICLDINSSSSLVISGSKDGSVTLSTQSPERFALLVHLSVSSQLTIIVFVLVHNHTNTGCELFDFSYRVS